MYILLRYTSVICKIQIGSHPAEDPSDYKEVVVVGDLVRIDFEGTEDLIAALRTESGAKETFETKFLAKEGVIAHGSTWARIPNRNSSGRRSSGTASVCSQRIGEAH